MVVRPRIVALLMGVFAVIGAGGLLLLPIAFGQTYCHTALNAQTFPITDSFGVPFDVFSAGEEAVIRIICGSPLSTVQVGNGKINHYIFEEGYTYRDHSWQREPLNGPQKNGNWLVGNATGNIAMTREQLPQPNFFVAYICNYINGAWFCGCKAQNDCANNRWSLQVFQGQPSALVLPQMTFTQSISSIRPGGSVTLNWTASNATRCFGYGDNNWPGDKPFSGSQTITNIRKDERYHLECEGPGGSRMLLIQVWMLPDGAAGFTPTQ